MSWTTPADLRDQLHKLWDNGAILAARIGNEPLFPRDLRLRRPSSRDLTEQFGAVQEWVQALQNNCRQNRGFGYEIQWREVRHRVHGANSLPRAVTIPTEADALRLIGRREEAALFSRLAGETLERFPSLRPWLERRPLALLQQAENWPRILAVLEWFRDHPRPGVYLRELDIAGVDTKFIETHRGLFGELLDILLPDSAIDSSATGARGFERRYGLRSKPPLIRFRILDPALSIRGLTDLSVPPEQFAALDLPARRVFITENEINGLAFPDAPGSLVIFGLGYGLNRLADIPWLRHRPLYYWGDIDTHGFAMLNRLRRAFADVHSILMDRATLDVHRDLWGQEPSDRRFLGELPNLSDAEQALYCSLRDDVIGERIRLEQERVGIGWLRGVLASIAY